MATENSKATSTGLSFPTLEQSPEQFYPDPIARSSEPETPRASLEPKAPSGVGRILAAMARWFLVVLLIVVAPVGVIAWSVTPRVTSPSQLAGEAIDSGLTAAVRSALIDQFATSLAESDNSPFEADELRPVVASILSQEWLDGQLTSVASELDRWLDTSSVDPPELVVDLTPVKRSLVEDDQAVALIAQRIGCGDPRCAVAAAELAVMLVEVPDEVEFLAIGDESDDDPTKGFLAARDTFRTARGLIGMIPLVLIAALAAVVLLARRGARLRWLGGTLIAVALPILAVVTVLPSWAAQRVVDSIEGDIPLELSSLEDVFGWVAHPAGFVAWLLLAAGVIALGTSSVRKRLLV